MLGNLKSSMAERDIRLSYDDEVLRYIAKNSYSEKFGARNMRRYIERNVEDPIANAIIDCYPSVLLGVHLTVENDKIALKTL